MRRILVSILAVLGAAFIGLAAFVITFRPAQRPAPDVHVQLTQERIERGRYLATSVTGCDYCHSRHDWNRFGGPIEGAALAGGETFGKAEGMPGDVTAPNLTPDRETGLGAWSDGEILRALREGVDRHGKAIFPMMPYPDFAELSDEDATAIVAYLRSIAPVAHASRPSRIDFPVSFFTKLAPKPLEGPVAAPPRENSVAYGKYLTAISGCKGCHTPVDSRHVRLDDQLFAGGQEFRGTFGTLRSTNLTKDNTGLGELDRQAFIDWIKSYEDIEAMAMPCDPKKNTIMPWLWFARMTEDDLGAIYDYLRTVPAIRNDVIKRPPATDS